MAIVGYIPITINSAYVGDNQTHFPWIFDLSRITDTTFWSKLSVAGDIVVTDAQGNIVPSFVDSLNTGTKTGSVSWDATVFTSANSIYKICASPGAGTANLATAFTNSNCLIRHSMDGSASPLIDSCGNYNLTNTGMTLSQTGKVVKGASTISTTNYMSTASISQMNGTAHWTVSALVYINTAAYTATQMIMQCTTSFAFNFFINGNNLYCYFEGGRSYYGPAGGLIPGLNWYLFQLTYDGTQGANANRVKLYVNGSPVTWSASDLTIPTTMTTSQWNYASDGTNNALPGTYDEVRHYTDSKTAGWATSEYNAIFTPAAVTIGSWSPSSQGNWFAFF